MSMQLAGPGRLELGAEGDDRQHRKTADPLDREIEQFARGWVNPMSVLKYYQYRAVPSQTLEPAEQLPSILVPTRRR